jgi:Flp pilus assembly protein TadG
MLALMMGLGELAFQNYVQSVLTGAVQKAARDSTIQGNSDADQTAAIDAIVQSLVKRLVPSATFVSTRSNYDNYAAIAGEPFTDSKYPNDNTGSYDGVCNHGETYVDVNGNGQYDLNLSSSGQGGANEITNYTMAVTYRRIFPINFFGWGKTVTLSASTLFRNQPYATQVVNTGTKTGNCS